MAIKLKWAEAGVEYICSGNITLNEVRDADDEVFNDERFPKAVYVIINALNVDAVTMNELEIKIDVAHDFANSFNNETLKVAFLADKPHLLEVAELYVKLFSERHINWDVAVFPTVLNAHHWIGQ